MTVIAIDGPSASGKSTLARHLAERLGIARLDTGAMYRAVALAALREGVALDDGEQLAVLARSMRLEVGDKVLLDGEDVSEAIRSEEVTSVVSKVAAQPGVRSELVARQRRFVIEHGSAVVEGRDIGSVVLPDADLKLYLTASPEERARRRALEQGRLDARAAVEAAMATRDALDSTRQDSPLVVAPDAVSLDGSEMSIDELVEHVLALVKDKNR